MKYNKIEKHTWREKWIKIWMMDKECPGGEPLTQLKDNLQHPLNIDTLKTGIIMVPFLSSGQYSVIILIIFNGSKLSGILFSSGLGLFQGDPDTIPYSEKKNPGNQVSNESTLLFKQ